MNFSPPSRSWSRRRQRAFTMVEIAISIAIVGFALVAIIGVLPTGVNVQKQNREETIINQDGSVWLEAIRSGATGLDYLTNYVDWIQVRSQSGSTFGNYTYDYKQGYRNGRDIIGLLSLPKVLPEVRSQNQWWTNTVQAFVRGMSGPASDKAPHNDFAFWYRLTVEVVPFNAAPGMVTNLAGLSANLADRISRTNLFNRALNLGDNLYDLRLTFDWPVYLNQSGVRVGANRKVFRTLVSGSLVTNGVSYLPGVTFYFLQPSQFVFIR
jgi:type II secretory pathway pseudopilin PulG